MKSLIKFLPVAFGALVMASCSNNDLFETNGSETAEYQLKKGEILVTVGEETSATRASIGEAAKTENGEVSLYRSVFWRENDQIKVYDAKQWRPQYFKWANNLDGVKDYAKNAAGPIPAVFVLDATQSPKATDATQYEDGYAFFPGERFSKFDTEERNLVSFDFDRMKYWSWDAVDTKYFSTTTADGKSWFTEFPMWGNVKESKLALKYLTGFLRIDLSGYKEVPAGATRASLVIQATKQLAGQFVATRFDYTAKQAPLLESPAGIAPCTYALGTFPNTIKDPVSRATTDDDEYTMVINLPIADLKANEGKMIEDVTKHNVFFIPVPVALTGYGVDAEGYHTFGPDGLPTGAVADPYDIRVSLVYDTPLTADDDIIIAPTLYDAGGDVLFEKAAFDEIDKAGRFYNIDCIDAGEVNTPYQLGKLIQSLDKIGRNVTVNLKTSPVVKGNETPQDMNLYVGDLKHNITINFPMGLVKGTGPSDNYHHYPAMYITKSGKGKLTLNFNGGIAGNYPAIVIRDNGNETGTYQNIQQSKTESEVILTSDNGAIQLPLVVVETANDVTTLKCDAAQVNLKGKMTIDALDKTINVLDAKSDGDVLTLKNGTITELKTVIANKFTCNSYGKSFIKDIFTPTPASINADWSDPTTPAQWVKGTTSYKNRYNEVTLNSTWDGNYYTDGVDFNQQSDIHTAAQFSMGAYAANSALHTNLYIGTAFDGSETTAAQKNWLGKPLAQNFDGLGFTANILTTNATLPFVSNGLFSSATANLTVKDLKIKADIQPSAAVAVIGGLFGFVAAPNTVNLYGVSLEEGSKLGFFTSAGNYTLNTGSKVGGLIGEMQAGTTLTAMNCSVKGEIAGFAALGGYVGSALAGATLNFGRMNRNTTTALYSDVFGNNHAAAAYAIATSEVTFKETRTIPATLFNPNYGTIGMFLGKAEISGAAVAMNIYSDRWSAGAAQAVASNDKIAGQESALLFHKHHILAGYDANGNEMYNNYKGSKFNVIGTIGDLGAGTLPAVFIGDGFWGSPTAVYQGIILKNRQQNQKNTDVPGIETAFQNWFEPDAE